MRTTLSDYLSQFKALLPQGAIWPRDTTSQLSKLSEGIAEEPTRIHNRIFNLLNEADPRTVIEALQDWERVTGLPDICSAGVATTLQERRHAVVGKLNERGGGSKAYFVELARRLGYEIEITEFRPFICGISQCGVQALNEPHARLVWAVRVFGPRITWFRCGESQCGTDHLLKLTRAEDLECRLHKLKPAHTTLVVGYQPGRKLLKWNNQDLLWGRKNLSYGSAS